MDTLPSLPTDDAATALLTEVTQQGLCYHDDLLAEAAPFHRSPQALEHLRGAAKR
jgi:hypothetical protein